MLAPFADLDSEVTAYGATMTQSRPGATPALLSVGAIFTNPKLVASGDSCMLLAAWKQPISGDLPHDVSKVDLEQRVEEVVVSVDVERLFGVEIKD